VPACNYCPDKWLTDAVWWYCVSVCSLSFDHLPDFLWPLQTTINKNIMNSFSSSVTLH